MNVEETNSSNSSELVKIENIEGTPFKLVESEMGCFIAYGNNRLTEMQSKKECLEILEQKNWNFIGTFVISVINSFNNFKNLNNE